MKDLDERIYEILEKRKRGMTINEIAVKLNNISKKAITSKLQEMNREGIVFRSIKEGKACYSINKSQGEGRNPTQENMNNIKRALNTISSDKKIAGSTNLLSDVELFNKFKIGFIDFDIAELKYNKNCIYEDENYKMEIPDSFVYLPNDSDRDFVAYLPKKDTELYYEDGGSNIIIYSGSLIPIPNDTKKIEETKRLIYDLTYWTNGVNMFERLGGNPEYKDVKLNCGRTALIYMKFDTAHNFQFMCALKNNIKQMRIVIDSINGNKEELEKIAISIMNKFSAKEEIGDFEELDDKKYLVKDLKENVISKWAKNIEGIYNSIKEYSKILTAIEISKANVFKDRDIFNVVKFKAEVREELKENRQIIEKYIKKSETFFKNALKNNIDVNLMIPAYYWFKKLLEIKEVSIDLGYGFKIVEKIELAKKVEKEFFNKEILNLIQSFNCKENKKNLKIIEKEPEQLKREQDNENRKEFLAELKNDIQNENKIWEEEVRKIKAELENKKKEVNLRNSNEKNSKLEKLEKDKNSIIKDLSTEMEKLTNDNKEYENEINTLGFLQFMKKDKLKMQIDINNQNINKYQENIAMANEDYRLEYNQLLRDSEVNLNNEISNLDRTYKLPEKPDIVFNKVVSIIEKRNFLNKIMKEKDPKEFTKLHNKVKSSDNTGILVDKNLNNTFSADRKGMYELLKRNRTFKVDQKNKYKYSKNLSKLRVFQILFSLEEDNLVIHKNEEDGIEFQIK